MEINNTNICPKCGGPTNTYRHINAKIWCSKCGFILKEEGVPWTKKFTQEEIDSANNKFPFVVEKITPEQISNSKQILKENYGIDDNISQNAINNINILLHHLKLKLGKDNVCCNDELIICIAASLNFINDIPPFTYISFEDDYAIILLTSAIISGAFANVKETGYDEFYQKVNYLKRYLFHFDYWSVGEDDTTHFNWMVVKDDTTN
jgi:ribosomal protein S27AE